MKYQYEYEIPVGDWYEEEAGFGVVHAEDPKEALAKVRKQLPDGARLLIIYDEQHRTVFDRSELYAPVV